MLPTQSLLVTREQENSKLWVRAPVLIISIAFGSNTEKIMLILAAYLLNVNSGVPNK